MVKMEAGILTPPAAEGKRPADARYKCLALVSHPLHVDGIEENGADTLIVSCNWLLAEELAAKGRASVYIDDAFRKAGVLPGVSREMYLKAADWLYGEGDDPTVFHGVSLGRRFLRDFSWARLEIGFYENVLPPLVRRYGVDAIDYVDCRTDWGPLDAAARFDAIAVIARRLGVEIRDRRMEAPSDGLQLPHKSYLKIKKNRDRPTLAQTKNAVFNRVMDGLSRLRRLTAGGRPAVLLLTTVLNGKPLLEAFEKKGLGVFYLSEWFPGKSRVGFLLRCLVKGVMPVSLGAARLGTEDRRAVETIREKIGSLITGLDDPFAAVIRSHFERTVLATERLELAAEQINRVKALLERIKPAMVLTDGLQNTMTTAALALARERGIPTAATWHAPFVVDHRMEIFGSDPRTPALADYCLTWGRGHEEWLDANESRSEKIRTGNIVAARCRKLPHTPGRGRRALVLQYVPVPGDNATWYTPSNEYVFFIDVTRMLREAGFDEIQFRLHPGIDKLDYYRRIASFAGITCEFRNDTPFPDHLAWADIVIGIPSSGAALEVLRANRPFYPVLLPPDMVERRYLYGLKTYDSADGLRRAILDGDPEPQNDFLEAFTAAKEYPDPAQRTWQAMEEIIQRKKTGAGLKPAVFLDRDGVINRSDVHDGKPFAPTTLEGFEILPGVPEAVAALNDAGFKIIVSTNQPDVKKGVMDKAVVEAMNDRLRRELPIDDIKVCYHVNEDHCGCRKPKPGMLVDAAAEWGINLEKSFMVGDRWSDVDAGKAAGCRTIFIDYQYAERRPEAPDYTVASLAEAATLILSLPTGRCQGNDH